MNRVCFSCLLICVLLKTATAADRPLDKVLTSRFHDKIFSLRLPLDQNFQAYDAEGQPLTTANVGPWTVYGAIVVNKIAIDSDKLRVGGKRVVYVFKDGRLVPLRDDEKVMIAIRFNSALSSEEDSIALLNRVFLFKNEDVINAVPPYWRSYLSQLAAPVQRAMKSDAHKSDASENQKGNGFPTTSAAHQAPAGDQNPFRLGEAGLTAPKLLSKSEPEFSEPARKLHIQGTVGLKVTIDSTGRVSNVTIVKPMGAGLDENAVNAVSMWRFAPATKDGRAVPIVVYIEVDFHLG